MGDCINGHESDDAEKTDTITCHKFYIFINDHYWSREDRGEEESRRERKVSGADKIQERND